MAFVLTYYTAQKNADWLLEHKRSILRRAIRPLPYAFSPDVCLLSESGAASEISVWEQGTHTQSDLLPEQSSKHTSGEPFVKTVQVKLIWKDQVFK